ncbi:MAG: hypothetical protein KFF49_07075 [Bacteroidales bacterium]|nr:hypothetical protein [Bacteroidales bacterium]
MKYPKAIFLACLLLISHFALSQQLDSIDHYFSSIAVSGSDEEMLLYNDSLTNSMLSYLDLEEDIIGTEIPDMPYLGQVTSRDSLVKIFSWNIPLSDGDNLYNCIIYNHKLDNKTFIRGKEGLTEIAMDAVFESSDWYGSLYYDMQPLEEGDSMSYILLGFDPDNVYMNSKVVEVLHFDDNGRPVFGKKIFSGENEANTRLVFRYSPLAIMSLQFSPDRSMIIFDHLAPSSPRFEGQYMYYGPDFSYDALEFIDGKLILVEDIDPGK